MSVLDTINILLKVTDKLMDRLPNYSQRKKKQYLKLRRLYEKEIQRDYSSRDDNLVDNYRDELLRFIETFSTEIS
jgi:hypothetical protein